MIGNIVSYFGSVLFLIAGIVSLMICYYKDTDARFKFKNTFPYELNFTKVNTLNVLGKVLCCLSFVSLAFFFVIYPIDRSFLGPIDVMVSFISVFGVLSLLSSFAIATLDMRNVKLHLIGDTFLFSFAFILTAAIAIMGFWTLKTPHTIETIDIKKIVCSSVAIIEFIILCILLFNPKLRNWAKLEEKSNEDGTKIYLRPKWFALAYSEWAFIGSIYFNGALLFIMFI